MIYLGGDHRGFELKEAIKEYLNSKGEAFEDLGDIELNPEDDYPVFAEKVARAVAKDSIASLQNDGSKGIVICGSGAGVDITANKVDGVRCALAFDVERAKEAREHDNANVMALPADALESNVALEMVKTFLETPYTGEERHQRRLDEIKEIEENQE